MEAYCEELLEKLKQSGRSYDMDLIRKALVFGETAHSAQRRESGEPYFTHPVKVAEILCDLGMDTPCIVAALLHDTVEDTSITEEQVKKEFGAEVCELVRGVTKLGKIPFKSQEEAQVENLRNLFLAMAKDIRVILIKLADRLHNMRTLKAMPDEKRRKKALETMEVYAPLAHRLGMQRIKLELEDLSLQYLDPIGYEEVSQSIAAKESTREAFLNDIIEQLHKRMDEKELNVHIEGRIKHVYSVYRKMYNQNKGIDEIYDLYAVRVITYTITDCYYVLGLVHDMYKPIPGRFKDYISTPKPNLYQSLHTTVIGKEGIPFEIQIRTWDMHRTAEYGIAAHWKYKSGVEKTDDQLDSKLQWVRQMLEIQDNTADPEDFMRTFKIDLFSDEVYVFTPRGDLINLPAGSTPIDFAYAIHSAVGNKMIGAKVNGKMVQLDYQVQNGEIIEVLTSGSAHGPSRDWLKIAKTSSAKNKIKQWFKREKREENIERGKADLDREMKRLGINLTEPQKEELLTPIAKRIGITGLEELYSTIGYGGLAISRIINRIREDYEKLYVPKQEEELPQVLPPEPSKAKKSTSGVVVEGIDGCLIKFARCCNPLPGDDIIGYITKGFGVSVHRRDCANVVSSLANGQENERWINVSWAQEDSRGVYGASLSIIAVHRMGLMADITTQMTNMRVELHGIYGKETDDGYMQVGLNFDVGNSEQLRKIMGRLEKVQGVVSVKRGSGN